MEVFSPPPSPTPVHFNVEKILEDKMLYVFGVMAYTFELTHLNGRLIIPIKYYAT